MFFLPDRTFYFTSEQDTTLSQLDTSACKITEKKVVLDVYLMHVVVDFLRRDGFSILPSAMQKYRAVIALSVGRRWNKKFDQEEKHIFGGAHKASIEIVSD